jgi:phosphatidylglycerol:prolipoprotein diacylglycerol transferase
LIAAYLLPLLQKYRDLRLSRDAWLSLLSWSVLGVIVGGRLGYVFFYEPAYFLQHPAEIIAVWHGGMAFHGGFIGVCLVLWIFARKEKIDLRTLGDIIVIPVAIGLALGRLGNFLNQELYGTVTSLPWGMSFDGVTGLRHPIQFYEMTTDVLAALLCFLHLRYAKKWCAGRTASIFLIVYGIARFSIEYVRDQQYPWTTIGFLSVTRGQLLTIPVMLGGIVLWFYTRTERKNVRR